MVYDVSSSVATAVEANPSPSLVTLSISADAFSKKIPILAIH